MESVIVEQNINALKAIIKAALCQGFSKTSYLVTNHIKYIKNIQSANNPERYITSVAKKLFSDEITFLKKFEQIKLKYKGDLLCKFEELYTLYLTVAHDTQKKKTISEIEADDILTELLF